VDVISAGNLSGLLKQMQTKHGSLRRLTISRNSIFEDSIAHFKMRNFDYTARIKVTFEGEPAVDGGGPVREFFTILMRQLLSSSSQVRLFEGRNSHFLPLHNTDALRSNLFKVAARMVAASICHGGPGFPVFPRAVYMYFQNPDPYDLIEFVTREDVVDIDVVMALDKVELLSIKYPMIVSK
jgi:hypothetical protein